MPAPSSLLSKELLENGAPLPPPLTHISRKNQFGGGAVAEVEAAEVNPLPHVSSNASRRLAANNPFVFVSS